MTEFGAAHGIMGNDYGIDLPQTEPLVEERIAEKNMAKFSRTKEFKQLKEHLENRIDFYQKVLPDGRPLTSVDSTERIAQWVIANAIIGELKMVINIYENAKEAVDNATR